MPINFQYNYPKFKLKEVLKHKQWIKFIIEKKKKQVGELNYQFADDETVFQMNVQFLNHSTYTDIITFDNCINKKINGDIIISIDRVIENAKKLNISFEEELRRVMIHGVLHLCGYKDKKKEEQLLMRKKENKALQQFLA